MARLRLVDDPKGRKDAAAAAPFVLDAAAAQELLDAAAARKQAGQAAPAATKTTGVGAMGKAAAVAHQRHAMEAGTGEGRQRTGTALGLKRKAAAAAVAPSKVAPVHDVSRGFTGIPSFTGGHGVSSPTSPPWMRSQASDPAACIHVVEGLKSKARPNGGFLGLISLHRSEKGYIMCNGLIIDVQQEHEHSCQCQWQHYQISLHEQSRDNSPHPPGGFMRLVSNPPQNFHFVGATGCSSPPFVVTPTPHLDQDPIHVDSGDEVARTEKRILWTQEEDVRLMSAWLKNSTDSINGADRRNEQYWGDVVKTYNMTTSKHRIRNQKQVKDRWHKINKWTDLFHSAWLKARRIYTSGHSDQMWIDKAHKFYEDDNKSLNLGHFVLMDVWYAVRGEAKWITYNNELKKARKRKSNQAEGSPTEIEDEDVHELPRPMGQKKAKKMAFDAKKDGKSKGSAIDVEQLEKYSQIQAEAHANRLKVLEVQQKMSTEKLEASRLNHLASVESKEAKMMEAYNSLLSRDTEGYSAEEKEEHLAALRCLRKRLFPED